MPRDGQGMAGTRCLYEASRRLGGFDQAVIWKYAKGLTDVPRFSMGFSPPRLGLVPAQRCFAGAA